MPGVLIARPDQAVFFGNADTVMASVLQQVRTALASGAASAPHAVVLSLEESPDLDSTSIEALTELANQLTQAGVLLRLARVKDSVRDLLPRLQIAGLSPDCYSGWSVDDAVRRLTQVLDAPSTVAAPA